MKLTDYVINFLVKQEIGHIFGLTGGAVVHFFNSAAKTPGLQTIFCHHEQSAALAAVAYARIKNSLGAVIITTGPGGTNTITGLLSAWQDSIPCLFISGQARREHTSRGKQLRQLGTQEFDIVSLVKPITKYAVMVEQAERVRYHLEKAVYLAKEGRPGPVWVDIPLDLQWASIEPDRLQAFSPPEIKKCCESPETLSKSYKECLTLLAAAKRPLILAGYGVRLAHAEKEFREFVDKTRIPFVSTWTASDIVPTADPYYAGRLGVTGQRGGNFSVQNCDFLLCLGSHLSIPSTGTLTDAFAREAKIAVVDIDRDELGFRREKIDLAICCDVKVFLGGMMRMDSLPDGNALSAWRKRCTSYKSYNLIPKKLWQQKEYVNSYVFIDTLSDMLKKDDIITVDGGGTNLYVSFQAFKVIEGQRLILSSAICSMGTGLPESIGACFAGNLRRTICLSGDGSIQLNIQELQTIIHHRLPIKIFVMNNSGYLAIRHTQDAFLEGNYVGSAKDGGLSLPDFLKVAEAYGLKTIRINNHRELSKKMQTVLEEEGPVFCELMVSPEQQLIAQQGFDRHLDGKSTPRPLEDMYPYLDRKEFFENMIIKPWP